VTRWLKHWTVELKDPWLLPSCTAGLLFLLQGTLSPGIYLITVVFFWGNLKPLALACGTCFKQALPSPTLVVPIVVAYITAFRAQAQLVSGLSFGKLIPVVGQFKAQSRYESPSFLLTDSNSEWSKVPLDTACCLQPGVAATVTACSPPLPPNLSSLRYAYILYDGIPAKRNEFWAIMHEEVYNLNASPSPQWKTGRYIILCGHRHNWSTF